MRAILVTGGAGYIGSHTAKMLAAAGYFPVVLDNLSTGNRWAVKWGPLVEGDIRDEALVTSTVQRYEISAVLHLAASAHVGASMTAPIDYFDNNVVASLNFLRAVVSAGVRTIVFSSSCATYGQPVSEHIAETHPQQPINPYGESKLVVERALHWYDQAYGLKSICLRYFNAAGADADGDIGESHSPETHLVPLAVQTGLGIRSHFDLYGEDYSTPDGTPIRDLVHVNDIAQAHLLALEHLFRERTSQALNVGAGRGHSVREVIRIVEQISGIPMILRRLDRRAGDPPCLIANARLASEVLGWRPRESELRHIVESAWHWHSRNSVARSEDIVYARGTGILRTKF